MLESTLVPLFGLAGDRLNLVPRLISQAIKADKSLGDKPGNEATTDLRLIFLNLSGFHRCSE